MATAEQLKKMGVKQEDYIKSPGVIEDPNKTVKATPTTVVKQPVLDNTNPKYVALIQKGYTPEQISNAWKGIQEKQARVKPLATQPETVDNKITNDKVAKGELSKDKAEIYDNPNPNQQFGAKKEGQPDYQDISPARQTEIINNLEGFFAANPNSFNNEAEFKKTYSVGTGDRNPKQDQWIMNWYAGKKDAIATNSANQVKLNNLTGLNDTSLANISPEDAIFLYNNDKIAYLRYQKAKTDKDNLDLINGTPILNKIIEEANANKGPDYEAFIKERNAELLPLSTEIAGLKTTYENMKNQYDNILADTQKQYQGETSSFVNAMAAKKQREILPQLTQAQTEYNNKANLYNQQKALLDEEFDMQVKQQETERNDLATKLALYEAQYGSFGERAKYSAAETEKAPEIQNFGTTKAPNWKQWNTETKSRESISGIGGGAAGGGTGGGGGGGQISTLGNEYITRYNRIKKAIQNAPDYLPLSTVLALPENAADLDFVKNNLSLLSFKEAKAAGVTFGSTTQAEWDMLKKSQISLPLLGSKKYALAELDRLAGKQGGVLNNYAPIIPLQTNNTINNIVTKRGGAPVTIPVTPAKEKTIFQNVWDSIRNLR